MPRPTFENLDPVKRERFVLAARDEFAVHPYPVASITRLVGAVGIAKGSVYQYFDDKLDLFAWLVEEAGRRKLAQVGPLVAREPFPALREAYARGLVWFTEEPAWARIGLRATESFPELAEVRRAQEQRMSTGMARWLRAAKEQGAVRPDLDVERLLPFVLGILSDGLLRAFLDGLDTDLDGLLRGHAHPSAVEVARRVTGDAVDVLERVLL